MTTRVTDMTMEEIRQTGMEALAERLGPYGMVQFLKQFERGKGDYTKDREEWLPRDMDTIIAGVKRLQEEKRR